MDNIIKQHILKEYPNRQPIFDGIVSNEDYNAAKKKILWILKEPNSANDDTSWDMRKHISTKLKTNKGILDGWDKTFSLIVYVTYGVLKNESWSNLPYLHKEPDTIDILKNIAYINVKKTAGLSKTSKTELNNYYKKSKDILFKQIELFNPDILIFGGTFYLFKNDLLLPELNIYGSCHAIAKNNQIFIDAYHPNNRTAKDEVYFNDLLNAIKQEQK